MAAVEENQNKSEEVKIDDNGVPRSRLFPSSRMTMTVMMFLACVLSYILRLNMGFAMVCMARSPGSDEIANTTDLQTEVAGEFAWEKSLQGSLLAAFFYGYIVTLLISGWFADRFGGKKVLAVGLGAMSILTLLLPEAGRLSPYAMLAVRVLQGMFGAVNFPATHSLFGKWAPPTEIGFLMAIAYSGMYAGTLVTFPICGLLCKYGFAGGWPSVFYVTGLLGLVYVILMWFTVYDSYEMHPRISTNERLYLEKTIVCHQKSATKVTIPWKELVKSGPVFAISVAHFCCNFGFYTFVINLPLYMRDVFAFKVEMNGLFSSLPYIASLILNLSAGKLTDLIRQKRWMTMTTQRKLFNSIGMIVPGSCMLYVAAAKPADILSAIVAIVFAQGVSGFAYSGGFFYNHVDLSPKHAGILMGFTNTFGTLPGILSPLLVGYLTANGTTDEWSIIFYIGSANYLVGAIIYAIFASGERQKWSYTDEEIKEQLELKDKLVENNVEIRDGAVKV